MKIFSACGLWGGGRVECGRRVSVEGGRKARWPVEGAMAGWRRVERVCGREQKGSRMGAKHAYLHIVDDAVVPPATLAEAALLLPESAHG
jgi:hypothetical protein